MDNYDAADMDLEADFFASDDQEVFSDRGLIYLLPISLYCSMNMRIMLLLVTPSASDSQTTWYTRSVQRHSSIWLHGTQISVMDTGGLKEAY